jgi:hypothetical protein
MTAFETTQYLNLAKSLNLLASGHQIGGTFYVYDSSGHRRTLESFMVDFPLERLQAMITRMQASL